MSAGLGERRATVLAPAKVNLSLLVGEPRDDGYHELVSVIQPVAIFDHVRLEDAPPGARGDQVVCPGVAGPNLAAAALAAYRRASGWDPPPLRVTIDKRIPIAGGMGGGSSDAAATLLLAAAAAGREGDPLIAEIAPRLGADVPAMLHPVPTLVAGFGEQVLPLARLAAWHIAVLPLDAQLSTAAVFAEADRRGATRDAADLAARRAELERAFGQGGGGLPPELIVNDLEPAARALCPAIDDALAALRAAGARHALVSGSGPTTFGLFPFAPGRTREALAEELRARCGPRVHVTAAVVPGLIAVTADPPPPGGGGPGRAP